MWDGLISCETEWYEDETVRRSIALFASVLVLALVFPVSGQDTQSHRILRGGLDTQGVQLRLELLQRLQEIARQRQEKGLPPIDPGRLSPEVRKKLQEVQQADKQLQMKLLEAQLQRELAQQQKTRQQRSPNSRNGTPSQNQQQQPGATPPPTPTQRKVIENLIKPFRPGRNPARQRNSNQRTTRPPSPRDRASPTRRFPDLRSQPDTPSQRSLDPSEIDNFDISEWLDRMQQSAPPTVRPRGNAQNNSTSPRPRNNGSRNSRSPRDPVGSGTQRESNSSQNRGTDRNGQSRGRFSKNTWKELMKSAKSQGRAPRSSSATTNSDGNASGTGLASAADKGVFANAFERTAEGLGKHVEDILRNQQRRRRSGQSRSSRRSNNGFFSGINRMSQRTTRFFNNQSRRVGGSGSSVSMPSAPSPGTLLPFVFGAAAIGVVWFLLRNVGNESQEPAFAQQTAVMPAAIHSRQDVIDAFHYIAGRTPEVKGNWWTHSRVAKVLAKLFPTRDAAVRELTAVYETARYLPPDEMLTEDQLRTAREAIKRCVQ